MNLVATPMYYAGGGFPWGFLIIAVVLYLLWQKGVFGGGPGRYGGGYSPRGDDGGYGSPRERFEAWHREAHATAPAQTTAQPQPQPPSAPPAPQTTAAADEAAPPDPAASGDSPRGGASGPALEQW